LCSLCQINKIFKKTNKPVSVIQHINRMREKNHIIFLGNEGKAFDKIQYPFMIMI